MTVADSSRVVQTFRRLMATSALGRGLRAIGGAFGALDAGMARAAADKDAHADADAARIRALAADSRLVQALDRLFAAPEVAWEHSRVRTAVLSVRETIQALALWQRVRLLGWMIVVAVTTRAALYAMAGNPLTAPTLAVWGLIIGVGAVMMAAARSVAIAWVEWRRRRG
jgi:hypothetical protein